MQRIINQKRYDTKTAKALGSDGYGNPGDFEYFEETLYRKKTGEFFLYGYGGARSRYAKQLSANTWAGGERIIPMTEEEAREWAEKHLSAEEYEETFAVDEETPGKTMLTVYINAASADVIRSEAKRLGMSQGDYIERLVKELNRAD